MVWIGIVLFVIGAVWFLFAPGSKSASPKKKLTKKKDPTAQKKPHRHKEKKEEGHQEGFQAVSKNGLKQPAGLDTSPDLAASSPATPAADPSRALLDELIVTEPLNDRSVHTPVHHASSYYESEPDSGYPEQHLSRSLWFTPVSQLTRPQLEMLLKAYFENEGTGYELVPIRDKQLAARSQNGPDRHHE